MKILNKNCIACGAVLFVFVMLSFQAPAQAAPVAPYGKMNAEGIQLTKKAGLTQKDLFSAIPDKKTVGLPIYPGAIFASSLEPGTEGGLPTLNLVSNDPPAKVRQWYADKMKDWIYNAEFNIFYDGTGKLTIQRLLQGGMQTIGILEETGQTVDLLYLDVPNVKSRIQIVYRPK